MDYVTYQDVYGTLSLYDVLEKEFVKKIRNKNDVVLLIWAKIADLQ